MKAFVAGATGYTGREVVRLLVAAGVETVAHVRPDSASLESWRTKFAEMGAECDSTAWQTDAMSQRFQSLEPDLVFGLIGTTRARRATSNDKDHETYDAVDYGLTAILIDACTSTPKRPAFVYLSSLGVGPNSPSSYIQARWKAEEKLLASGLRYIIARPAFISGDNRDEARPMERVGAIVSDGALGLLGAVGLKGLRDKYASMDNTTLAGGLVGLSMDDFDRLVVEPDDIRKASTRTPRR